MWNIILSDTRKQPADCSLSSVRLETAVLPFHQVFIYWLQPSPHLQLVPGTWVALPLHRILSKLISYQ